MSKEEQSPPRCALWIGVRQHGDPGTYILEAAVEDLKLLAGETCLGFKLFQALGTMADCR